MKYDIDVDTQKRIVLLRIQGVLSASDQAAIRAQCIERMISGDLHCLLVDVRDSKIEMSTMELYHFGESFTESGLPRDARVAILRNADDEDNRFIATVARNRGFHMRSFLERSQALDWLCPTHESL